jgi:hypothetical protein
LHHLAMPDDLSTDSTFTSLDVLMIQREPLDLSNAVTLEGIMPVDRGGFGYVRLGRLNGVRVRKLPQLNFLISMYCSAADRNISLN